MIHRIESLVGQLIIFVDSGISQTDCVVTIQTPSLSVSHLSLYVTIHREKRGKDILKERKYRDRNRLEIWKRSRAAYAVQ